MKTLISITLLLSIFAIIAIPGFTACNLASPQPSTTTSEIENPPATSSVGQTGPTVTIDSSGNFNPAQITIKPGDTITWINEDNVSHTITSWKQYTATDGWRYTEIGKLWDSGDIQPGNSYSRTFNETGRYRYVSFSLYLYIEFQLQSVGVVAVSEERPE